MTKTWGATPDAWAHWSALGLAEDLLPVVSNPEIPISESSKITQIGKTPSELNFRGHARGIPKWTERRSTLREIEKWAQVPDLGICLQTRQVKAIDIDVDDPTLAARIVKHIEKLLPWVFMPVRTRSDSGKCLLLFKGPLPAKRVIPVEGGIIEWLSTGQQCVVEGTHVSGQRYTWAKGRPTDFPELDAEDFETLWQGLCNAFAKGEPKIAREKRVLDDSTHREIHDPQADWLVDNWPVHDAEDDGTLYLRCPFDALHTTDTGITATRYAPAGTGGFTDGAWKCLHAHCEGRSQLEFEQGCGWAVAQFDDLDAAREDELEAMTEEARAVALAEPEDLVIIPRAEKSGLAEANGINLYAAISSPRYVEQFIAYDRFLDAIVVAPYATGEKVWREFRDEDYMRLRMRLERRKFKPMAKEMLRDVVALVARERPVDMAQEWLSRQEWDGTPRVDGFMRDYLGCDSNGYAEAVGAYMWTAHAGRVIEPACQADMVAVLVGKQGARKTSAIKAIAPAVAMYTTIKLHDRDDNLSRQLRGKLVGELEELRGLNSREAEEIKAWISCTTEEWVPKFKEFGAQFPRRLVFWGSTNDDEFLADPTGERRWLPIKVGDRINVEAIVRDRDQLWAEAAHRFRANGVEWQRAEMLAKGEHEAFKMTDVWEPAVVRWLNDPRLDGTLPKDDNFSVSEALSGAVGMQVAQQDKGKEMRMGKLLKSLGFMRKQVRVGNARAWRYGRFT